MAEKKIELTEIDPVEIFGVNDKLINRLANYFPKLKVVPRGNTISLKGSSKDITSFQTNLNLLIAKRGKKRSLNLDDIDQLFEGQEIFGITPELRSVSYTADQESCLLIIYLAED